MNDFKTHINDDSNHYTREKKVIDIESKPTPEESEAISATSLSTEIKPVAPLSDNKYIAFFQKQWRKIKEFYANHKKAINISALVVLILGIGFSTWLGFWLINIWNNESSLAGLGQQPNESSIVYAADGSTELFRFFEEENREVVELDQISENMQQAIIALEDENFYYNESGIPWTNLFGAAFECGITLGETCRGASGLSQQLIKNVKKDDESTVERKVRELFTAVKLNEETTKEDILSSYLNWVPFGRNAYGVQQAASIYFDKDASELDLVESCYLASMVQRPSYFNTGIGNPESQAYLDLEFRKDACLAKIFEEDLDPNGTKLIESEEELASLQEREIEFQPRGSNVKYPHFRDFVSREISKFVNEQDLLTGGYTIITTLDPEAQEAIEASIEARKDTDILGAGANNVSVVAVDGPSSEIVAMVGSLDYNNPDIDGQVNVATAPRQPGSSIKPYVYAASFKQGLYPGTMLLDAPTEFEPGYAPKNFSGNFTGGINIRNSLAGSLNIPAVKAAYLSSPSETPNASEGINAVFDTSTAMGLDFPCIPASDGSICNTDQADEAYRSRCGISASLGGCEVSLISHVAGFNTFGQDGRYKEATPFKQILDTEGNDIYADRQNSNNPVYQKNDQALDPLIARQINNVMSDYNARYPIFGNSARRLELEGWNGTNAVAAKTGTTNDVKDTWTVGYSPLYSVAVWVGNTDSTPLNLTSTSVGTTSGIWNDAMTHLHADKEKVGFSREGLQTIEIDPTTGLPTEGTGVFDYITESQRSKLNAAIENLTNTEEYNPRENNLFANGTINIRSKVKINTLDDKIADPELQLEENIEEKDFNQLVAEYPQWQNTADEWMERTPELYEIPPTEVSDQDQKSDADNKPTFSSNLDANTSDVNEITVDAQAQGIDSKTITNIEIQIDGTTVSSTDNQDSVVFSDIDPYLSGSYEVVIIVTDSFGATAESTYDDVTFEEPQPVEITESDISSLSISCDTYQTGDTETTCSFSLGALQSIPGAFRIRIGDDGNTSCSENNNGSINEVICTGIPIPIIPGTYPIKARVENGGGSYIDTVSSYVVTI
jgi:membrane peptidoglycan carboxypeptidase